MTLILGALTKIPSMTEEKQPKWYHQMVEHGLVQYLTLISLCITHIF